MDSKLQQEREVNGGTPFAEARGSTARQSGLTVWQEQLPDREGHWWMTQNGKLSVVNVKRQRAYGDRLVAHLPNGQGPFALEEIENYRLLWAGPIPHPVEP
jgi:hypothetical protein